MRSRTILPTFTLLAAVAVALTACGGHGGSPGTAAHDTPAGESSGGPVTISEAGSTLLYPLMQLWAPAYHRANPQVTLQPAAGGSGKGIADAAAGTVDLGASDAYLSPAQRAQTPGLLNIPVAVSAQIVDYDVPGAPKHLKLDGTVLQGVYDGSITSWDDPAIAALNPGATLPKIGIVPLHRSDSSGDTFLFTQYLSATNPTGWGRKYRYNTSYPGPAVPGALAEDGNGGMVTGCAHTPGCIAYLGVSYRGQADAAGLGEARLKNASGVYLLATAKTIAAAAAGFAAKTPADQAISMIDGPAADGYPIVNNEYAVVNRRQSSAATAAALRAFLTWAGDPSGGSAAGYLDRVGFQPLPAPVRALSATQIATIR